LAPLPPLPPVSALLSRAFPLDHTAGPWALREACSALRERAVDVAVVSGLDSHLHRPHLDKLIGRAQVKTALDPNGLIPGEAGAAVVLERQADARTRQAPILARVGSISASSGAVPYSPELPVRAEALSDVLQEALHEAAAPFGRIIVDLNGERWRFLEWGLAETRCGRHLTPGWQLWHPADCLGDVGAASGPLFLCLAVRAFARRYAGEGGILLVNMSADGQRAATVLHPPS
jgi:3-oxoacyl-[acyl-carrier-protein] synthase-1